MELWFLNVFGTLWNHWEFHIVQHWNINGTLVYEPSKFGTLEFQDWWFGTLEMKLYHLNGTLVYGTIGNFTKSQATKSDAGG